MVAHKRKPTETAECGSSKQAKISDYISNWSGAVANYVRETETTILDLAGRGLGKDELQSILTFLPDTKITELNLEYNYFRNGLVDLAPLLVNTKITKLNVSDFEDGRTNESGVSKADLLRLFGVLNDSQITHLSALLRWNFQFNIDEAHECLSHLQNSKLTRLDLNLFNSFFQIRLAPFFQDYLNTSITCLDLKEIEFNTDDFIFLFANLHRSLITELNLQCTRVSCEAMEELSKRLAETKIEKLNFGFSKLREKHINLLVKGLINSKVTDLNLEGNRFWSPNPIFAVLKKTRIRKLNVAYNLGPGYGKSVRPDWLRRSCLASLNISSTDYSDEKGAELIESLRFSNVTKLSIACNHIGILTVKKLAEHMKDLNLTDLNISQNPLSFDAFFLLGKCLKKSKLTRVSVDHINPERPMEADHLLSFLKLTEGSLISRVGMSNLSIWTQSPVSEPKLLANTRFTELGFYNSSFGNDIANLIRYLKFSAVTHLNLTMNRIGDDGATVLAESLKGMQIRRLILNENSITSQGAKALATALKDSNLVYLHLRYNLIDDEGLECLAENAKDIFISEIDVLKNPGKKVLLVDKVLWENKVSIDKLVNIFKEIAPCVGSNEFCFDQDCDDFDVDTFLEKCLWFYRTVVKTPRAINVLLEEENESFSREQISRLLFEEFPRQFSEFTVCRIEASLAERVKILEKAEEMGVTAVVESLLLNRPVYMLDEELGILHPYVYKLLLKYKQPICNLAVEPRGVIKIIEYFTEHADIEGAQDVNNLLRVAKIS